MRDFLNRGASLRCPEDARLLDPFICWNCPRQLFGYSNPERVTSFLIISNGCAKPLVIILQMNNDETCDRKTGSGAWTRTKILGSKGPCAANCTTPEQGEQNAASEV